MGELSLNLPGVFGTENRVIAIGDHSSIKQLCQLLAEKLLHEQSTNHLARKVFKNKASLPIIYDPRLGILPAEMLLKSYQDIKNIPYLLYYSFPDNAFTIQDIYLENKERLGDISLLVIVNFFQNQYPIILPTDLEEQQMALNRIIFTQIKAIAGEAVVPQDWQSDHWQLQNLRTGERINCEQVGTIVNQIAYGDVLILTRKQTSESDDVVIVNELRTSLSNGLDIRIDEELADTIQIEQIGPVKINNCVLEVIRGDISLQVTDAIVNTVKSSLDDGGEVNNAIHRVAGPDLVRACRALAPCAPGKAVLTPGFSLSARWVIHAVGPIYENGEKGEDQILEEVYRSCLSIAMFSGFNSISFPAISTGANGYPIDEAAKISIKSISQQLKINNDARLQLVKFVVYDEETYEIYSRLLHGILA